MQEIFEKKIQAQETVYDGHKFRSRTEARWAVFFRHMGLCYEYELENEGGVLPDFYLPDIDVYIEVKGRQYTEEGMEKERKVFRGKYAVITQKTGKPVIIAYGCPFSMTGNTKWNRSDLIFYGVPEECPSFAEKERKLYSTKVWFSSDSNNISLSTELDSKGISIVACCSGEWKCRKYIWTKNLYNRDARKVALYAGDWKFEYETSPYPKWDSRDADSCIESLWRSSKYGSNIPYVNVTEIPTGQIARTSWK